MFHNITLFLVKESQSFIRLGFFFKNNYKKVFLLTKCLYICTQITTNKKLKTMIDLNTITKEDFANELLMSNDCNDFYLPREKEILSLNFDFAKMKKEFENWLIKNCDN